MTRFKAWLSENSDASVPQVLEELRAVQTMASLRPAYRLVIFLGAAFSERFIKEGEVAKHKAALAALSASSIQQRQLIAAAEWLCGTRYSSQMKFFPVLLQQFYEEDLVKEEVFFEWDADSLRSDMSVDASMISDEALESLRSHAKPFLVWLQEAEEEDEEEGEDDDESGDAEEED